jgi:hypothetical protein
MTTYTVVKRIVSTDGKRRADIRVRDDGAFYVFTEDTLEAEPGYGDFWSPTHQSGLYADAESAEREARLTLPWLRDGNSN